MDVSSEEVTKMERTLDPILPPENMSRNQMSYLYGRDPSILAFSQRPGPSAENRRNLLSDFEIEESVIQDGPSLGSETLSAQTVKVYLRLKPFPKKMKLTSEQAEAYQILNTTTLLTKMPSLDHTTISMKKGSQMETVCRKFTFTETFGPETSQLMLFERVIQPQMEEFFAGQNCIAMTYGTTNSGKSHTLQGSTYCPGIIPRSLEYVFSNINPKNSPCYKPVYNRDVISLNAAERLTEIELKTKILASIITEKHQYINAYKHMQKLLEEESPERPSQPTDAQYLVWVSFAEIYNETIYDLLCVSDMQKRRTPLKLATDSQGRVFIKGLRKVCVNSGSEAYQVLMAGQCNLKVAATALNARSSRSHCIFTITLLKFYHEGHPESVEVSKFSFCDLAGSERLKKTLNVGDRLKEAQNINTSLLVLGRCLKSIYEGQILKSKPEPVGPFRESKLTRLFQNALSGREPMALIVNVNPLPNLYEETQNVLNFAAIAKKIVIQPKKEKRRKSLTRFSLVVAQSAKTTTDWDETELEDIAEQSASEVSSVCSEASVHNEEYEEILAENERLRRQVAMLKASKAKHDLEIRQELAASYSTMMEKLESDYKNKIKCLEDQQEDLADWRIAHIREYYEKKLVANKRMRIQMDGEEDESSDDLEYEELEAEKIRIETENTNLKNSLKQTRKQRDAAEAEKNTLKYELGLVNSELNGVKSLLSTLEQEIESDGDFSNYVENLKSQLASTREKNMKLKAMLNEAKDEYIAITDDCRDKEQLIAGLEKHCIELQEKCRDLEESLEDANQLLRSETKSRERFENQLEIELKMRAELQKEIENSKKLELNSTDAIIKQELKESVEDEEQEEVLLEIGNVHLPTSENIEKKEELIVNLKREINHLQEEKLILAKKYSESAEEVTALKEDLNAIKQRFEEISKQCDEVKSVRLQVPDEKVRILSDEDMFEEKVEIKVEVSSVNTQTMNLGVDQGLQTSFPQVSSAEKSLQTTLSDFPSVEDLQQQLEEIKAQNEALKLKYDTQTTYIDELKEELSTVKGNLVSLEAASTCDRDLTEKLTKKTEELQEKLRKTATENENLVKEMETYENKREELERQAETSKDNCSKLKAEIEEFQKLEQAQREAAENLKSEIESIKSKCEHDHISKISELKDKLQEMETENVENKQVLNEHLEKIQKLEENVAKAEHLNNDISKLNEELIKCQSEKNELEFELKSNTQKITSLEARLKQAEIREKDKDEEISKLQKEVKAQLAKLAEDSSSQLTEKEYKKLLQELNEIRESHNNTLSRNKELEHKVEVLKSYEESQKRADELQRDVDDLKTEIKSLKEINAGLTRSYDEKEIELETFKVNRDNTIARYEALVKTTQDDLEREKREVMRYQELLSRQALTPGNKDDNQLQFRAPSSDRGALKQKENKIKETKDETTSDEISPSSATSSRRPRRAKKAALSPGQNNENEIPVIELSGSESKRTTRRTAAVGASTSEKRANRRKRLFNPETSLSELTQEVPSSPAASTRSMRSRRK